MFAIGSEGSQAQIKDFNDNVGGYLEIVEDNLVRNIQNNFDFFTEAFNNFDSMKLDMNAIAHKA